MRCDINSDLGEGFGAWTMADDAALLTVVTSANVACGFHAGDPSIMQRTCEGAVANGVRIGAHIGYRDLVGFGRRALAMKPADVTAEAVYQMGGLDAVARAAGDRVRYVKPHGALYHSACQDEDVAAAIVTAVVMFDPGSTVLGPAGSCLHRAAVAAEVAFVAEGFADRGYLGTGALVTRSGEHALLGVEAAAEQALSLARTHTVRSQDGTMVRVPARSICLHGDSPNAVQAARAVRTALERNGVIVEAFT